MELWSGGLDWMVQVWWLVAQKICGDCILEYGSQGHRSLLSEAHVCLLNCPHKEESGLTMIMNLSLCNHICCLYHLTMRNRIFSCLAGKITKCNLWTFPVIHAKKKWNLSLSSWLGALSHWFMLQYTYYLLIWWTFCCSAMPSIFPRDRVCRADDIFKMSCGWWELFFVFHGRVCTFLCAKSHWNSFNIGIAVNPNIVTIRLSRKKITQWCFTLIQIGKIESYF